MFLTCDTITDDQIRELFAEHCECRPLNTARISHAHDCEDDTTEACRIALHGFVVEDDWPVSVSAAARREARAQCAHFISRLPTYRDYIPDGTP